MPNEVLVASQENNSPLTTIAIAVKAGARHEPATLPGVSHILRCAASLSTTDCTGLSLTRNLEQLGATFSVEATRDHLVYVLEATRRNMEQAFPFLALAVGKPAFKPWQFKDQQERLLVERAHLMATPECLLVERLHAAAYRDGLRNSLFAPEFSIKNIGSALVKEYHAQAVRSARVAVAGIGIDQETLQQYVTEWFDPESGYGAKESSARYMGGSNRLDTLDYRAYASLVYEAPGSKNAKESLAASVLQQMCGVESGVVWGDQTIGSPLAKATAGVSDKPHGVSSVYMRHSDSGLFGISVVASASEIGKILEAGRGELDKLRKLGSGDAAALDAAKRRVCAQLFLDRENSDALAACYARQALNSGTVASPAELARTVDSLTARDVDSVAKKIIGSAPTFSAVGNLSACPDLEDLVQSS